MVEGYFFFTEYALYDERIYNQNIDLNCAISTFVFLTRISPSITSR